MKSNVKDLIYEAIQKSINNFMHFDRKEDEDLELGAIEEAIENEEVSKDEIIKEFNRVLEDELQGI